MALLTSFLAAGRCPNCGNESAVWIQSHYGDRGATYEIGDDVSEDIPPAAIESTSFLVRTPALGEPIHTLSTWSCDVCNVQNFAELVFVDGKVADIRPVELTLETLGRLHYVATDIFEVIEAIIGRSMWDEYGVWPSWVRGLREKLTLAEGGELPDRSFVAFSPLEHTLGAGQYKPDEHYLGGGSDQLFFAHSPGNPGIRYLVSSAPNNGLVLADDAPALLRPADGLFLPRFVGEYDAHGERRSSHCAYVEELPAGEPVGRVIADTRPRAVRLGVQVGRLLARASRDGVINVGVRPEYVWVVVAGDGPTVTGIGGRSQVFFSASSRHRDLPTARLFTQRYAAPEVYRGEPVDDRALVLTVALMTAEWLVGRYPFAEDDGAWGYRRLCSGEPIELPVDGALAELLRSALRPEVRERPGLADFLERLAAFAPVSERGGPR